MPVQVSEVQTESKLASAVDVRNRRRCLSVVVLVSLVYFVGLAEYARVRPIDADEGFYTTAARLVWEGKVLYRDFAYIQAPLLPHLYGWVWAIHPGSLIAMRMLSAVFAGTTVLLWGLGLVCAKRLEPKVALVTFLAIVLNPSWFSWSVVVKTYPAANLLITIAVLALYLALRCDKWRWYFAGGLALGLCASVRSLYGPLIPAVLVWCLYTEFRESRIFSRTLALLFGSLAGTIPMIWSFGRDPRAFIFNNVLYRVAGGAIVVGTEHVLRVYLRQIFISLLGLHPYFVVSGILAVAGAVSIAKMRPGGGPYSTQDHKFFQLMVLMLAVYVVVALIPFPPLEQYFVSPLVPLTLPFVAEGFRVSLQSGRKTAALALVAPVLFSLEIGREARIFSPDSQWRVSSYRAVTQVVEASSSPNDIVLSLYPGYVFESCREYFPGLENQWGLVVTLKTTPTERAHYRIVSTDALLDAVYHRKVSLVVIDPWIAEYYRNLPQMEIEQFRQALLDNYTLLATIDDVKVYRRNATKSAESPALDTVSQ
jgi:hypothetical protein